MTTRIARARAGARLVAGEIEGDRLHVCEGDVPELGRRTGESLALADLRLVAPVAPRKVVAVALNYRPHASEMQKPLPSEPMFFLKPSTSVVGPGEAIRLPPDSRLVHHEAEMGLVIGRRLCRASVAEAREAIFGITGVIDVTARDIQRSQSHYTRAKGYDTFCPIGPTIVRGVDPTDVGIVLRVNGEVRQDGRTSGMIFGPYELASFISHVMTLEPGDVISTGTPAGVGPVVAGDEVELEVEHVGVLRVGVEQS